jgi:hypothetical protein
LASTPTRSSAISSSGFPDPTDTARQSQPRPPIRIISVRVRDAAPHPRRQLDSVLGGEAPSAIARRSAAVAVDASITALVAVALFFTLGSFWIPLTVFMACYYWGGILLLGNSPGVCLQGPADHHDPPNPDSPRRRVGLLEAIQARFAAYHRAT